jgi:hypothetical protein
MKSIIKHTNISDIENITEDEIKTAFTELYNN